jgi:hypothetical protein
MRTLPCLRVISRRPFRKDCSGRSAPTLWGTGSRMTAAMSSGCRLNSSSTEARSLNSAMSVWSTASSRIPEEFGSRFHARSGGEMTLRAIAS